MIAVMLTKGFIVTNCEDLDAHTDLVMEALLALESDSVMDSDVAATLSTGEVEISVTAVADDFDEAAALADSAIRTAIHAADGHTPGWKTIASVSRELVDA